MRGGNEGILAGRSEQRLALLCTHCVLLLVVGLLMLEHFLGSLIVRPLHKHARTS